jgi:tRNA pseudouridine13 synthase
VRGIDALPQEKSLFPNYFDDQRFGKSNDEVGKALVKGDFAKACGLIDDARMKEFLQGQPSNYVGALSLVPKKILTIYVHAYQSRLFNRVLERLVAEEGLEPLRQESLPLVGFGTEDASLYEDILAEEGITPRDFIIRQLPELSAEGGVRAAVVTVDDLWIGELEDDELNEGRKKVLLKFSLPKGSYATGVVKSLFSQPE